jgi:hypothetical protein
MRHCPSRQLLAGRVAPGGGGGDAARGCGLALNRGARQAKIDARPNVNLSVTRWKRRDYHGSRTARTLTTSVVFEDVRDRRPGRRRRCRWGFSASPPQCELIVKKR